MRHLFKSLFISCVLTLGTFFAYYVVSNYSFLGSDVNRITQACILLLLGCVWLAFVLEVFETAKLQKAKRQAYQQQPENTELFSYAVQPTSTVTFDKEPQEVSVAVSFDDDTDETDDWDEAPPLQAGDTVMLPSFTAEELAAAVAAQKTDAKKTKKKPAAPASKAIQPETARSTSGMTQAVETKQPAPQPTTKSATTRTFKVEQPEQASVEPQPSAPAQTPAPTEEPALPVAPLDTDTQPPQPEPAATEAEPVALSASAPEEPTPAPRKKAAEPARKRPAVRKPFAARPAKPSSDTVTLEELFEMAELKSESPAKQPAKKSVKQSAAQPATQDDAQTQDTQPTPKPAAKRKLNRAAAPAPAESLPEVAAPEKESAAPKPVENQPEQASAPVAEPVATPAPKPATKRKTTSKADEKPTFAFETIDVSAKADPETGWLKDIFEPVAAQEAPKAPEKPQESAKEQAPNSTTPGTWVSSSGTARTPRVTAAQRSEEQRLRQEEKLRNLQEQAKKKQAERAQRHRENDDEQRKRLEELQAAAQTRTKAKQDFAEPNPPKSST